LILSAASFIKREGPMRLIRLTLSQKPALSANHSFMMFPLVLFLLIGLLSSYPQPLEGQVKPIRDALGNEFFLGKPPARIISLAPNLTEILFALGLQEKIIGVTRFCNYPPEVSRITKVGGVIDPSLEKITSLKPDLILAFRGTPLSVLSKMKDSSFPLFVLDEGTSLAELLPLIQTIGLVTGSERQANQLSQQLQSRITAVQTKITSTNHRPKVFLLLSGSGYWTCGRQSFLHDLIIKAGGENIAAFRPSRWALLGSEELVKSAPEMIVILAPDQKAFTATRERFLKKAIFKSLPAIIHGRLAWLDEDSASRFGPRLVKTLEDLARFLHPECF